jgi:hypothetical protein
MLATRTPREAEACPGTTANRKLEPPRVRRSVLLKPGPPRRPGTPWQPRHPAGNLRPADPARRNRHRRSGRPDDAEERR